MLRLSMLVIVVCAFVSAGCSGDDAPKPRPGGPTTQVPADNSTVPA